VSERGDRPKKSWRELDAMRDRAAPRGPREDRDRGTDMNARASKQYRAALDALFEKGEVGKLAEKLSAPGGKLDPSDVVRGTRPSTPSPALNHRNPSTPTAPSPTASSPTAATAEAPPAPARKLTAKETAKEDARTVLRKKVLEALGREEISRAVDRYVKAHGWPDDFEVLEQALEHTKAERQTEAMAKLEDLLRSGKPKRSRSLAGKLRFIEETSDGELRDQAARIRAKL
jgi:hypothetical protein